MIITSQSKVVFTSQGKMSPSLSPTFMDDSSSSSTVSMDDSSSSSTDSTDDSSSSSTIPREPTLLNQNKGSLSRKVSFNTIEIHEHAMEMGVSGIPRNGAPLTIGWERQDYFRVGVDDYESQKPPSRTKNQILYSQRHRNSILLSMGYTMTEILQTSRECNRIRRDRETSARPTNPTLKAVVKLIKKKIDRIKKE